MTFVKDPDAVLDYPIDWSDWLNDVSDTITDSTWLVPAGLTEVSASFTDTATVIFLSGGTLRQTYSVTNRINTAGGRTADHSISIEIMDK